MNRTIRTTRMSAARRARRSDDRGGTPQRAMRGGRRLAIAAIVGALVIGAVTTGFGTSPGRPSEIAISDGTSNT
jgi:hypothetical protein